DVGDAQAARGQLEGGLVEARGGGGMEAVQVARGDVGLEAERAFATEVERVAGERVEPLLERHVEPEAAEADQPRRAPGGPTRDAARQHQPAGEAQPGAAALVVDGELVEVE